MLSALTTLIASMLFAERGEPVPAGWVEVVGDRLVVHGAELVRLEPEAAPMLVWDLSLGWRVAERGVPLVYRLEYGERYTVRALSFADDPLVPQRAYMVEEVVALPASRDEEVYDAVRRMLDAERAMDRARIDLAGLGPSLAEITAAMRRYADR